MKKCVCIAFFLLMGRVAQAQLFPDFTKAVDYFSKTEKRHTADKPPPGADPETGLLIQPISVKDYFEADTVDVQTWYKGRMSDQLYYLNYSDFKASKSFQYPVVLTGEYYFRITSPKRTCFELLYLNAYGDPISLYSELICPD